MKKQYGILIILAFIAASMLGACGHTILDKDYYGKYMLEGGTLIDSFTSTKQKAENAKWVLELEEHNNFSIKGNGMYAVGYWHIDTADSKGVLKMTFQSGGPGRFAYLKEGKILFNAPNNMFDSIFAQVIFKRVTAVL